MGDMGAPVLQTFDIAIIAAYLGALLVLGIALSRRRVSPNEYFLASRKAGWPAIGLALIGSNVSPGALIGITGSAYAFGISVYNYDWVAAATLVLFALLFLPAILSARLYTMPEFLERRYDWRVRAWFSLLSLFLCIFLDAAGALYCGTLVLRFLLPGLSLQMAILLLAAVSVLYAAAGGLRAVIYTQAAQAVMVLASALILTALTLTKAGGVSAVMQAVPPEALSLIRPADDLYMPWTGLLLGAPVMAFYFWCTNQVIMQRILAARSIEDGQKGALLAGLLKLLTLFVIILPGIAGRLIYPDLPQADEIYLRLAFGVLPAGLLGLLLAAFLGALMAQLSASYTSAASLVTMDFVKRFRPDRSDKAIVAWGRASTLGCMVISALWAPQIVRFPSLWQYFQGVLAYATPPVVALFLGGFLWPRATANGAFWSMTAGTLTGALLFGLSAAGVFPLQFLNAAAAVFAVSVLVLVLASLGTEQPPEEKRYANELAATVRRIKAWPAGVSGWAVCLLSAAAIIVFWFW